MIEEVTDDYKKDIDVAEPTVSEVCLHLTDNRAFKNVRAFTNEKMHQWCAFIIFYCQTSDAFIDQIVIVNSIN